ncbi:succinate dehydrogenase, hydrophobic membrane anchor protein [Aureimonas mangrovi]|uniref:succinate dehydrogenase, hydrophobic membrane anchor protein n=1 Tax=Aureimonas mangrovi TaxID=2758041 RepID=UPI00163D4FB1|nr:succinate dehydrogenase, hydrophobic membrane anchor protein [Aureimonas mangrovi]
MSTSRSKMITPLARVRGYGSAKSGTEHFWVKRVTAISNLFLVLFFLGFVVSMHAESYETVREAFRNPLIALVIGLLPVSFSIHMRLGMQTAIEDYFQGGTRIVLLLLNTFFAVLIAGASLFAVVRLTLGA